MRVKRPDEGSLEYLKLPVQHVDRDAKQLSVFEVAAWFRRLLLPPYRLLKGVMMQDRTEVAR